MSASKSNYPERLPKPRPKKPLKGKGRPSSERNSKKAKTFQTVTIDGKDVKLNAPWYRSPHRRWANATG